MYIHLVGGVRCGGLGQALWFDQLLELVLEAGFMRTVLYSLNMRLGKNYCNPEIKTSFSVGEVCLKSFLIEVENKKIHTY